MARKYKCVMCKEQFDDEVMFKVEATPIRRYCDKCFEEYSLRQKNRVQLDELYDYVRFEIMGYDKHTSLTQNMVRRLQSMRAGKMIKTNDDIPFRMDEGTPYKIILIAFKLKKKDIKNAIATKSFKNDSTKFNYVCAIVENYLPDAKKYVIQKKRQEEKLEILDKKIDSEEIKLHTEESKYVKIEEDTRNKDDFNDLW